MNGIELLAKFRETRSEEVFGELVKRYQNLVFSVAVRRLSSEALAQDAAQTVFLRLARSIPQARDEAALLGWLHRTTVHAAIDLWRAETRRLERERKAFEMQEHDRSGSERTALLPEVDEALNELAEADRAAILLRYFDGKSMRETGASLGVSEDAAKMRVSRSLERLRERLAMKGVTCSATALAGLLSEQAITAAPPTFLAAMKLTAGASQTAAGTWPSWLTLKTAASFLALGAVVLTILVLQREEASALKSVREVVEARSAEVSVGQAETTPLHEGNSESKQPNARRILERVAAARNRLLSGDIELEVVSVVTRDGVTETNSTSRRIVFDGARRRYEKTGTEYSYVGVGEAGERSAEIMRERRMNRAQAVEAGLLTPFHAREVTADDGVAFLRYRETNGRADGASILDRAKHGSTEYFDPRTFGLHAFGATIEQALFFERGEAFAVVGQEAVEGTQCWRVRVDGPGFRSEYWVSIEVPERLLRHEINGSSTVSRFTTVGRNDPLPSEVEQTFAGRGSGVEVVVRMKRIRSEYNIVVDPSFCTLAGLGMQRGTPVTDERIMRRIGYWDGSALSEDLPGKQSTNELARVTLTEMLPVLESEPETERGREAATWILLNTPDGPEVESAGEAILRHHIQDTNLLALCKELERLRHRCAKPILREALAQNPVAAICARACFSLGTIWKDEAKFGANKAATDDARAYFERILREFSNAGPEALDLTYKARREVNEIDRMFIGKTAPPLEGVDLTGAKVRLADQRGKVVLVTFWSDSGYSEAAEHRKAFEQLAGRNVAFIGVGCDYNREKALAILEEAQLPWANILDGRHGPIAESWMVQSWTSTFLVDSRGIIRQRDLRWHREIVDAVDGLLRSN